MSGWDNFNAQFAEDEDERRDRWQAARRKRTAEGKCWQCAQPVAVCTCPNVKHAAPTVPNSGGAE